MSAVPIVSLLLAATVAWAPPVDANQQSEEILGQRRYGFCSAQRTADITPEEVHSCATVEPARCPGLAKACARFAEQEAEAIASSDDARRTRGERKRRGRERSAPEQDDYEVPAPLQVPAGLARVLFWAGIIALAVVVLVALIRNLGGWQRKATPSDAPPDVVEAPEEVAAATAAAVEKDVDRLLELAARAAAEGRYRAAIDLAYAALLRRLDGEGVIELGSSRTNGEHVRKAATRRPESAQALHETLAQVEEVQFGGVKADEPRYAAVLAGVRRLLGRGVGALAVLVFAGATLACPLLEGHRQDNLTGLGTGPSGVRAVAELLQRHGVSVRHRTEGLDRLDDSTRALLVVGEHTLDPEEWEAIRAWTIEGGHLYIAVDGDWPGEEHAALPWWGVARVHTSAPLSRLLSVDSLMGAERALAPIDSVIDRARSSWREDRIVAWPADAPAAGGEDGEPGWDPYPTDAELYAVAVSKGTGEVIVFADGVLFRNVSLASGDLPDLITSTLTHESDLEIVTAWTGRGADNPIEAMGNADLFPLLAQIALFMLALYAARGIPFAALRDPAGGGRRSHAEHVLAIAEQYGRARAHRFALGCYATWVIERLRSRVGVTTRGSGLSGLAEAVAEQTGRRSQDVMRLFVETSDLATDPTPDPSTLPADLALMRELDALLGATQRRRDPS